MLLSDLVQTSQRVSSTSRRLEKLDALATLLRSLAPDEIAIAVAFLSGETRQPKLGVGPATILAARSAQAAASPSLTVQDVDRTLQAICETTGTGSNAERKRLLSALLARATQMEQEFLVRLLFGELRQGALEGLMLDAIARAGGLSLPSVRRAAMVAGGLGSVARAALTEGEPGLQQFALRLFQPVLPMLAQPAQDIEEALRNLGTAAWEWKLDGARIQVHKQGDDVRVFSRGLNDVTAAVPEIVEQLRATDAPDLILDGEAIALRENERPYPFQITMRRFGRRLDVDKLRASLPLRAFYFDCLRLGNRDLIERAAGERFDALTQTLPPGMLVKRLITGEVSAAQSFLDEALRTGHEGVMAKSLQAPYEAGSRGSSWLKIKQAHTLDLVILAAEWGHGRRHGWLSNLHLGARDPDTGRFIMLGKTFKGLTDAMLEWQTQKLLELEVSRDHMAVYVRPEVIVEIAVNEIQESSQYPGGLALRFARVKGYRSDKRAEEADTIATVRRLFMHHANPSESD